MITLNEARQVHGLPLIDDEKVEYNMEFHILVKDFEDSYRRVQHPHNSNEVSIEYVSLCGDWFPPFEFSARPLIKPTCESCILLEFEANARSASEGQQTEDEATYRPQVSKALQSGTGA